MKHTPLKRKTPLRRTSRLRASGKSAYRQRPRDMAYIVWVWRQPCCARLLPNPSPCGGHVEADHAGRRGMGRKAPDETCIPLCRQHHRERGSFSGMFRDYDQATMRAWLASMVRKFQHEYAQACKATGDGR